MQEVFVDLYHKELIYRGKRMVNWCPVSLTALSDEEVISKPQKGYLYHFKVEVIEQPGTFSTSRRLGLRPSWATQLGRKSARLALPAADREDGTASAAR